MSKCLLQDVGGGGYRVHDPLLEFVKINIKAEADILKDATERHAQYLGRLDVVQAYNNPKHGIGDQGFFFLAALWRSVEELSGDRGLQVSSYSASLKELEPCGENADAASIFSSIARLYYRQVSFN